MKKYIATFALTLATLLTVWASDPAYVVKAIPLNLDQVAKNISYPVVSNENAIEGTVLMYVEIDALGNVTKITALSYPCQQIRESVENALKDLKFEPAKNQSGEAVASSLRIPFQFQLKVD